MGTVEDRRRLAQNEANVQPDDQAKIPYTSVNIVFLMKKLEKNFLREPQESLKVQHLHITTL